MSTKGGKEKEVKVVERSVEINGVHYTLNSSNKPLLKQLEGGKKKDEKGNRVEQKFDYLPMNMVYRLMEGLFDSYDITSEEMIQTGETYIVKKFDYASKSNIDEEVKVFGKKIRIDVTTFDEKLITVVGYAEGVAGIGILSKDNARNGFVRKLTARARKEALANLGQVFRIDAEFDMDADNEQATVVEEESIKGVSSVVAAVKGYDPDTAMRDDFKMRIGEKLLGKDNVDKKMLIAALKEIKKEDSVVDGSKEHKILVELLESLSKELVAQK